jgi:hypothetical protein
VPKDLTEVKERVLPGRTIRTKLQLTPSTGLKIELKTQKWATDPRVGPLLGGVFLHPPFFIFGPGGNAHRLIQAV